jgi:hypothetical protein
MTAEEERGIVSKSISRPQIRDALTRSGYLLESRVEATLRKSHFFVAANTSYLDPVLEKSREIDIYAQGLVGYDPNDPKPPLPAQRVVLIIECVNNPQPLAFLTKEQQSPVLSYQDVKLIETPPKEERFVPFREYVDRFKDHHYCSGRIATQFCSFRLKKQKRDEWVALHEDDQFDCLRSLCVATDYFFRRDLAAYRPLPPEAPNRNALRDLSLYFPVLVLQGDLLEVVPRKRSVGVTRRSHLKYRRSEILDGKRVSFQIDVVREQALEQYLSLALSDMKTISEGFRKDVAGEGRDVVGPEY